MEIPEIREQGILSGILIQVLSVGHLSQEEKSILCCLLHKHMSYQLPRGEASRPGYVLSELYPPLPPLYWCCVENLQVSMRETHSGGRSNMRPGGGYNTEQEAQVGAGIILTGGV